MELATLRQDYSRFSIASNRRTTTKVLQINTKVSSEIETTLSGSFFTHFISAAFLACACVLWREYRTDSDAHVLFSCTQNPTPCVGTNFRGENAHTPSHAQRRCLNTTKKRFKSYLRHEKLRDTLGQSSFFAGENHFEHVAAKLLHHDEDLLGGFEHVVELHYAGLIQGLRDEISRTSDNCFSVS